jgi:fructose-1,6-bisphosphatase/inositol monophosphatase family enzyme
VAPGYEFANVDENGEFSFGVVRCPGLNNIYSLDKGDGHDHDHEGIDPSNNSEGDHFTATCGLWTGNTSFISNCIFSTEQLLILNNHQAITVYSEDVKYNQLWRRHSPRAPPISSVI